jgi:hypothetical protein
MADSNDVPVTKKRTSKTPIQAAQANADAAIVQLENLGGKLFKVDKAELIDDVRELIKCLRVLREKL